MPLHFAASGRVERAAVRRIKRPVHGPDPPGGLAVVPRLESRGRGVLVDPDVVPAASVVHARVQECRVAGALLDGGNEVRLHAEAEGRDLLRVFAAEDVPQHVVVEDAGHHKDRDPDVLDEDGPKEARGLVVRMVRLTPAKRRRQQRKHLGSNKRVS